MTDQPIRQDQAIPTMPIRGARIIVLTVRIDAWTNVKITVVNILPMPLKKPCTALVSAGHR